MRIVTEADVPDELAREWLQHLRNFDTAHPGCHFDVIMETERPVPMAEMVETVRVEPELDIVKLISKDKAKN